MASETDRTFTTCPLGTPNFNRGVSVSAFKEIPIQWERDNSYLADFAPASEIGQLSGET